MLSRLIDYGVSILLGALFGLGGGALTGDLWGGLAMGLVVGFFVGVGVRAWRTQETPESFEDRSLSD
jgi:hypothetical protein